MANEYYDVENRFKFHPPSSDEVAKAHDVVRLNCGALAHEWASILPDSREKAIAIVKLDEAMMWANAAIARNQDG